MKRPPSKDRAGNGRRQPSALARLFGANLDKVMKYRRISGRRLAKDAKTAGASIDIKTVNNARRAGKPDQGEGDLTLAKVADIAVGLGLEPWRLLVDRFDPSHLPVLRKRPGAPDATEDQYTQELLTLWERIQSTYPEERSAVLFSIRQVEREAEARKHSIALAAPPGPPEASRKIR